MPEKRYLMTPAPTPVPPEVLGALAKRAAITDEAIRSGRSSRDGDEGSGSDRSSRVTHIAAEILTALKPEQDASAW